jgi:uncharacterized surface protein with fasciclin (FAS1) repeats
MQMALFRRYINMYIECDLTLFFWVTGLVIFLFIVCLASQFLENIRLVLNNLTLMTKIKPLLLFAMLLCIIYSCKQEPDIYKRPEWLAGKVYTQIVAQPELSTFATCIELTGYDEILDVSGSYTVFSPSNEAFQLYFANHSKYKKVEDIPIAELTRIVKYHIVQNPWTKVQLRTLDVYGWIDTLDVNNDKPKGFKRETLLLDPNRKYGIAGIGTGSESKFIIVDTLATNRHRKVITESRKFVPIFYQEYFNIYDLNKSDYEFYFNRPFEGANDIYYAGAKIIGDEISAENGFVYVIDRVVEPLQNASQIIASKSGSNDYSDFLSVLNLFPRFEYNREKTFLQPGAAQGQTVDSLFNLTFPTLAFNFSSERTSPPTGTYGLPSNVTIRYHHGLMAPTNQAFQSFIDEYIKIPGGWGTFAGAPENIKKIIANTYLSVNTIYPTDFTKGFYNGELDIVKLDLADITEKKFGSNSTFIGLNKAIVPRALKSVTGPVYLQRGYTKVMLAIEQAGLLSALKRQNEDYMFFVENDANTSQDSSLVYDAGTKRFSVFSIFPGGFQQYNLNLNDLRTLLLNHVAVGKAKGNARKEFIFNLAGNVITVNNVTGEVSGTAPTSKGYRGSVVIPEFPVELSFSPDNGTTYDIKNWLSFASPSMFSRLSTDYPKFHALLQKAGLSIDKEFRYTFVTDNDFYTVFVPNDKAIDDAGLSTMPVSQLRNVLLFHFVQGEMIFTDGKKLRGFYETARIDEKSTTFTTVYTNLYIKPGIDVIEIPKKDGSNYVEIIEADKKTNLLTGVTRGTGQEVFPILYNNGVVHEIDKVLNVAELDIN